MELLAAGAAGAGVLSYNRKNFMFDKEQFREKAYFSQEMKIRKHELYREDIRDLTDLTVSKMDVYMVINVLQLLFCVLLFTEGMPQPGLTPLWLHWILAATSGSGVLYFVLSLWLAMHASIAAHSFGVRLLTQFVRLPVPNLQQIDSAAAKAKDYEALSLGQILRIPVLQQQLRKLTAAMGDLTTEEVEDTTGMQDNFLPEVSAVSVEETASLKHIQLYRELQANWQAYDAYSRVSMAMGTNQLLQSINAYCLGVLLSETQTGWAAACCMAVISSVAWLIVRLDVLVSWRILTGALALQLGAPLLTLICLAAAQGVKGFPEAFRWMEWLVPVIFALHFFWLYCCLRLATGHGEKVALPGKFRGVLYLDVFGWLSLEGENQTPHHASRRRSREAQRDGTFDGPNQAMPVAVHVAVADDCLRKKAQLLLQLEKWESPQIDEIRDNGMTAEVARLRQLFNTVEEELQATLQKVNDLSPGLNDAQRDHLPRVWLQLEWNTSGHVMEYWYDPDTGESRWSMPSEPDITSHLSKMNEAIETFSSQVKALATLIPQEQQRQTNRTHHMEHQTSTFSEVSDGHTAQNLLRGSNADAMPDSFFSSTAAAPVTFQPEQTEQEAEHQQTDDASHRRRAPGHLPRATFQQGTFALLGLWAIGVFWSLYKIIRDPEWVRPDVTGPGLSDLSLHWVRSSQLNLQVMHSALPHGHFRPQGLACDAKLGKRFFVAERYAVHQLVVPAGPSVFSTDLEKEGWQPAVQQCLHEVPSFLASGIRSITMRCQEECFLVLLDSSGRSLLTCPLGSGNVTHADLYGGPWQAVASSVPEGRGSGLWAKGRQGRGLVQLGSQLKHAAGLPQEQNASTLVPLLEVEQGVHSAAEHLAALHDGSAVLGLSTNGTLLVHQLDPPSVVELQLPGKDARWMGLCSPRGRELFLVGKTRNSEDFAIWRTQLPASF